MMLINHATDWSLAGEQEKFSFTIGVPKHSIVLTFLTHIPEQFWFMGVCANGLLSNLHADEDV